MRQSRYRRRPRFLRVLRLLAAALRTLLQLLGQGRGEFLQALQDRTDFGALTNPYISNTQLEPGLRILGLQPRGLAVRGDCPVEPARVPVGFPEEEERREGGPAYDAGPFQRSGRLTRLPGRAVRFSEQVPSADVLRVAVNDPRECRVRLRIFAAAQPGITGDRPPVGIFGIALLLRFGEPP